MAGTKEGGIKAAATNKAKYGPDFYRNIGRMGGMMSVGGGFTGNPEAARIAGRKGGRAPRRTKAVCINGHDMTGDNRVVSMASDGHMRARCRMCEADRSRRRRSILGIHF